MLKPRTNYLYLFYFCGGGQLLRITCSIVHIKQQSDIAKQENACIKGREALTTGKIRRLSFFKRSHWINMRRINESVERGRSEAKRANQQAPINTRRKKQEGHATRHTENRQNAHAGTRVKWSETLNVVLVVVMDEAEWGAADEDMPWAVWRCQLPEFPEFLGFSCVFVSFWEALQGGNFPCGHSVEILCQLLPTVLTKNVEAWCGEKKHFTSSCESHGEDVNLYVTLTWGRKSQPDK